MSYMSVTGEFEYGLSDGQVIYICMPIWVSMDYILSI